MLEKGLVQVYTGNGKGKTTAAFGLALRAVGWGKSVIIYQFLKPPALKLGERNAAKKAKLPIKIEGVDIKWNMKKFLGDKKSIETAKKKIHRICGKIADEAEKKKYDVIILDEIVFCLSKKLADIAWIKNIIESRDSSVEVLLTVRGATSKLTALADLVTEMKEIRHPFKKGIKARKGIEF